MYFYTASNFRSSIGVKRLQDVQKLSTEEKAHIYAMLDAFLLKSNIQNKLAVSK